MHSTMQALHSSRIQGGDHPCVLHGKSASFRGDTNQETPNEGACFGPRLAGIFMGFRLQLRRSHEVV